MLKDSGIDQLRKGITAIGEHHFRYLRTCNPGGEVFLGPVYIVNYFGRVREVEAFRGAEFGWAKMLGQLPAVVANLESVHL